MNISITHPESLSLDSIQQAIADDLPIYRSPHVGNVNGRELALLSGLAELGAVVEVELVDTVRGDDGYSRPHEIITSNGSAKMCTRRAAKSRVVSRCLVAEDIDPTLCELLPDITPGARIQDVHVNSLRAVMSETVSLIPSSIFYPKLGDELLQLLLEISTQVIDRPLRLVDEVGRILPADDVLESDIYGIGNSPLQGKLLPLKGMMAAELIMAYLNKNTSNRVVHVAGPHMIEYTKDPAIMDPTITIAQKVAAELGFPSTANAEYVLPGMATLLSDSNFPITVNPLSISSQYDMLGIQL